MNIYPDDAVILAPLAGFTDLPYRRACRRHGCVHAFTEMIDVSSLIHAVRAQRHMLARGADEPWLGIQLVGQDLEKFAKAVEFVNTLDFTVLDINLGCPAPKVTRKGKGAALAKDIDQAGRVVELAARRSRFPVTAKFRIQDEEDPGPTLRLARRLEESGAQALTIHGRIDVKVYSGPCHGKIIAAVRDEVKTQVVANGGVKDRASLEAFVAEAGAGPVMVARGAMGNPWLFEELAGRRGHAVTPEELRAEVETHVMEVVDYYGEERGFVLSRKVILDYLAGRGYPHVLKASVCNLSYKDNFEWLLDELAKGPATMR